jgi:phosphoglycolate phosphatase
MFAMLSKCRELNSSNVRELLDSVDVVLCDCDGVLWTTDTVIPGAPEAVSKIKALGKKVCFVTNNSNKSRADYVQKFVDLGFEVTEEDIFASSYVTAEYMKNNIKYAGKVEFHALLPLILLLTSYRPIYRPFG